jgi:predicted AAA+ superfamily ATPase
MKSPHSLPVLEQLKINLAKTELLQVILGPRQVGKTTSVLHFLKGYPASSIYESADKVFSNGQDWLREIWQKARENSSLLVIDEIQKIENWSEVVKKLWDEERRRKNPIKCILLGSSSLSIQRGLSESLTGRFQLIRMHHWNFSESRSAYDLSFEDYLRRGGYPGSYQMNETSEWANYVKQSIITTVIEKDILQENTVKSPALFRQAFEILMSYPAQEISYTKLLGQLQNKGNTDLVKHYIHLYEGAYLVKTLPKFSANQIKIRASSPKILPLCPAFYFLTILGDYSQEERGRAFEVIVGMQLVRTGYDLSYWREKNNEVDFVLKVGRAIYAIEVKSGRRRSANGIEAFLKLYPKARAVIITPDNYLNFEKHPLQFLENA